MSANCIPSQPEEQVDQHERSPHIPRSPRFREFKQVEVPQCYHHPTRSARSIIHFETALKRTQILLLGSFDEESADGSLPIYDRSEDVEQDSFDSGERVRRGGHFNYGETVQVIPRLRERREVRWSAES